MGYKEKNEDLSSCQIVQILVLLEILYFINIGLYSREIYRLEMKRIDALQATQWKRTLRTILLIIVGDRVNTFGGFFVWEAIIDYFLRII